MTGRILIVDDEPHILKTMAIGLRAVGFDVVSFEQAEDALKEIDKDIFSEVKFDLAFIDLMMFPMNGIALMQELHRRMPELTVVIITAHGTVETAVSALKLGAYDYLQKPFELRELTDFAQRVMKSHEIQSGVHGSQEILTTNPTFLGVIRMAERVASSALTILIEGETGTGKELLADFIHNNSDRAGKPMIKLNCAALSSELIESELFGHTKGAFTGAMKDRVGRVEAADGGTLFLDEVGEMPVPMQAKLLRFLQSREFQRVGENDTRYADVRIVAATNRNLEEAINRGEFREDLFYRLSGVRLMIPPLRVRREDILPLAERFVTEASRGAQVPILSDTVAAALNEYDWRGNVRELQNAVFRATILAESGGANGPRRTIELQDLPEHISLDARYEKNGSNFIPSDSSNLKSLDEVERDYIALVISKTLSLEDAARVLKIDNATLWRKRKKYSL